jgi:hypothetical protein
MMWEIFSAFIFLGDKGKDGIFTPISRLYFPGL